MKSSIIKNITSYIAAISLIMAIVPSAYAEVTPVDSADYSKYKQNFTTVDLKSVVNRGFTDDVAGDGKGGWADQGPTNDMSCFKLRGRQKFLGIDFDIIEPNSNGGKSALVLRGLGIESLPLSVDINIDQKCAGVYFLHTSPWLDSTEDVGSYKFNYEDGSDYTVKVSGSKEIFNWWGTDKSDEAVIAWSGNNSSSLVSLDIFPVANPYPDKKIKTITATSVGERPYLVVVGVTLTDAGPYLPVVKEENIGNPDTTDWYPYVPCEDPDYMAGTPIDMSYLQDAPAGNHGYIETEGDHLKFADGTSAHFWGICIAGNASFMEEEDARKTAEHMAQLGINCVRFHGMQSTTDTKGGNELVNDDRRRTDTLSVKYMDEFCYFLSELKKRGIYYGMDLMTGGALWKDDNIQDIAHLQSVTRGPAFFDDEIIKRYDSIAEQILTYKNPYTGMTIGEDPAFVFAALYNETGLFGLNDFNWPYYYPELKEKYNVWLRAKYPTREALEKAWSGGDSTHFGLKDNEDQFDGTVDVYASDARKKTDDKRYEDNMRFLGDTQMMNYSTRFERIRKWAPHVLYTGSTTYVSGYGDPANMYTVAKTGDFYSQQAYLYLCFGNGEHVTAGTHISKPVPEMTDSKLGAIGIFTGRKVYGKPYFQTEWDGSMPNPYRCEFPLLMSTFTDFQYWTPFQFCWDDARYSQRIRRNDEDNVMRGTHSSGNRPELLGVLPVNSQIVLRGDVTESQKGFFPVRYMKDEVYKRSSQGYYSDAAFAMCGKMGVFIDDIEYDKDYNDNNIMKLANYGKKTGKYVANTDEFMVDTNDVTFRLNTERTQAITGFTSGKEEELNDVIFNTKNRYSACYLTTISHDKNTTIHNSDHLLLTLTGDARNTEQQMTNDCTEFVSGGRGPIIIEPIKSRVTLKSCASYDVYALDMSGHRQSKISTAKDDKGFTVFNTTAADKAMNYEIVRTDEPANDPENTKISYIPAGVYGDLFDDLADYSDVKDKIERIYMQGYIGEVADRKFAPSQNMTRGEAIEVLSSLFNFSSDNASGFKDVSETNDYYRAVNGAKEAGIICGNDDNTFRGNAPITREELYIMTYNSLKNSMKMRSISSGKKLSAYADSDKVSAYAKDAAENLVSRGYITGNGDIDPQSSISRAEMCVLIYNILWE